MTSQESLLVLNAIPGMKGEVIQKLIKIFGGPREIFMQQHQDLLNLGISSNLATNIVHFPKDKFLQEEFNLILKKGIRTVTIFDEEYPDSLKSIDHAPLVLYLKGDLGLLMSPAIALVGARKATQYGLKVAEEFGCSFSKAGLTVVSGMALGIDTATHKGVLKIGGKTIAVMGCGLNHIYPKENMGLFEEIAEHGLLISEFPMDTAPLSYNFPRRNRIISGLSLATVIVEAAQRSGALITVDFALAQNKEIFVVPGNIDSTYSQGTNRLIKEGAKIALSAPEVMLELGITINEELKQEEQKEKIHVPLSVEEYTIYELVSNEPRHIDVISVNSGQEIGVLMGQMLNLELKGVIKQLPGQYYVRI